MRTKLLLTIIILISIGFAQYESENIDFVSQILSGPCEDIETDGDYSYIGCGLNLIIADLAEPAFPDTIFSIYMPSRIVDLQIFDSQIAIATKEEGVLIIDITDPSTPEIIGDFRLELDDLQIRAIDIQDEIMTICDIDHGIILVDISSISEPELISIIDRVEPLYDVDIDGDFVYIANGAGILIYDISTPSEPSYLSLLPVSRVTKVINIYYDFALIGSGVFTVSADISTPSMPEKIDSLNCISEVTGLSFNSSLEGAVSTYGAGVKIIAVDSLGDLCEEGYYGGWDRTWDVAVSEDLIQIAYGYNGLKIIDFSTPSMPAELSELNISGSTRGIFLDSDNLYVCDIYNGLYVIDITDPFSPRLSEHYNDIETAVNVCEKDGIAYVANRSNLIPIINTEDSEISELYLDISSSVKDIKIRDTLAYIIIESRECEANVLQIFNISDPDTLYEISAVAISSAAFEIELSGDYAFLAQKLEGLAIIDISNPDAPFTIETYSHSSHSLRITVEGICVIGDTLYIADSYGKLDILILDSEDYAQIDSIFYNELDIDYTYDVKVIDSFAFVACGSDGIRVYDVQDPSELRQAGYFKGASGGRALDIEIQDNYAYVSDGDNGITILDISEILDSRYAIFAENIGKPDIKHISAYPNPFNSRIRLWNLLTKSISLI